MLGRFPAPRLVIEVDTKRAIVVVRPGVDSGALVAWLPNALGRLRPRHATDSELSGMP